MAIEVEYFPAGKESDWLVKQFEAIHFRGPGQILEKFIPREDVSLVFHFSTPPFMLQPVEGTLPRYFLTPILSRANLMRIEGGCETFIATCRPTVLSRILGMNMDPASQIWLNPPEALFFPLWKQLALLPGNEERIHCFQAFLQKMWPETYMPDPVDLLYDEIVRNGVKHPLQLLVKNLAWSERTFQRQFRKRLGVSPKRLVRIVRINYLWEKIKSGQPIDYQSLVYEGNFFDQAHFIKDFKAITGETPDAFFHRDLQNVKIMSGKHLD